MPNGQTFRVSDLTTELALPDRPLIVVNKASFSVGPGKALGIVGESGAGKTILALSLVGRPPPPYARITGGKVLYGDIDLLTSPQARQIIGRRIGLVFENPAASLDPCYRIGYQISETIRVHERVAAKEARRRAVELLGMVGLPDPDSAYSAYPHQFSGGMQQRAVIATALSCNPEILIADNPTSALDVTIQSQIVRLIEDLRKRFGLSLIWITHNLGLVARLCDNVAIIYAGQIVEYGQTAEVIHRPVHPYTKALMGVSKVTHGGARMNPLPGTQPKPSAIRDGCLFEERCELAEARCRTGPIPNISLNGHEVRCVLGGADRG